MNEDNLGICKDCCNCLTVTLRSMKDADLYCAEHDLNPARLRTTIRIYKKAKMYRCAANANDFLSPVQIKRKPIEFCSDFNRAFYVRRLLHVNHETEGTKRSLVPGYTVPEIPGYVSAAEDQRDQSILGS